MACTRSSAALRGACAGVLVSLLVACGSDAAAPDPAEVRVFTPPDTIDFSLIGGGRLAFERRGSGARPGLVVIDADARTLRGYDLGLFSDPAISPDGRHVAFRAFAIIGGTTSIQVLDVTGDRIHSASSRDGLPAFRDSEFVLIGPLSCELTVHQVPVTAVDHPGVPVLTAALEQPCSMGRISMTADGRLVTAQPKGIYLARQGAPQLELIYESGASRVYAPAWSPAADRIAFIEVEDAQSDASPRAALRIMSVPGGEPITVTEWEDADFTSLSLAWCGHGSTLAYTRTRFHAPPGIAATHIWVVPAAGGTPQQLTRTLTFDEEVSCSA